ncbi:MAG: S9 family peptidase [Acidobacteria bacterium]|nr:S9 family peptidase [Acidobacteriota bacterium]
MNRRMTSCLMAGLMAVGVVASPPSPKAPPPLRDFFRNPEKTGFAISPDGKYLSWLAPYEKRLNVFVRPLAGGPEQRVTSETARDLAGYFWKGDRILYVKDFGGDENFHVVSVDLAGKDLKDLTPGEKLRAQIEDELEDDPGYVLISHNRRDPKVFDVFRVDVKSGKEVQVAQNPGNITGWLTDHDGRLRVATTNDGVNTSLLYRASEKDEFKPILTTNFKETVNPLFFTFDNRRLYVASNRGRDKQAIFEFDPATAKEGKLIFEHSEVDAGGLVFSRKRKTLLAAPFTTWKTDRHFLDAEAKAMFEKVQAQLPGYEVGFAGNDKAEEKFIVAAFSDRTRGKRYLYEKASGKLTLLAEVSPWLKEEELSEMKPVSYTSRDGLTIHGYLTLPKGKEAKNLPVVINPHGGPWARDVWRFNPEVQFLASRGYAVFQMNFRGSTGYGRKFWEASFKQWGGTMQDDVTDGVKWLVSKGIADPKRVAIYGGSYGGYTTLAGITLTPDLYAAAVDYVGVSNLFTFMKTIPPYWKPFLAMMYEMVGDPEKDKARMEATSPVFLADRIKTPLFIAQGAKDPRVNKDESDQMVAALKKRGVEVEYMVKDNEGHGFRNEENRFAFYEAMERFLAKHLKP